MRWKTKHHESGIRKIVTGFLYLPRTIDGEARWLEKAAWEREYIYSKSLGYGWWFDTRWID